MLVFFPELILSIAFSNILLKRFNIFLSSNELIVILVATNKASAWMRSPSEVLGFFLFLYQFCLLEC